MSKRLAIFFAVCSVALAGCAQRAGRLVPATQALATTQAASAESFLTLDQIQPVPVLKKVAATAPTTRPSIDALELFARARDALIQNQRFTAVNYLEQAIKLDPGSFELRYALGEAYQDGATSSDQAIKAFASAAEIKPDDLNVQVRLGRLYLAKGNLDKGIEHLRLAMQTADYATDDDQAGVVNFFLARALQQKGYDRAALDQYDTLLNRLKLASLTVRQNPELAYLIGRPEMLYVQIGDLYARHGQWEQALAAYEPAAKREPDNFELQARLVRTFVSMGKSDEARRRAGEMVMKFHAGADSLALLRETYQKLGLENSAADELQKLWAQNPRDRAILFALADMLKAQGRSLDAEKQLQAVLNTDLDITIVRRLVDLQLARDDVPTAAVTLIESAARQPDLHRELSDLWPELLRLTRKNHLRLADLQKLPVPPQADASRLFWVAQQAEAWNRDILARTSLDQAVKKSPPFAPAFRGRLQMIWNEPNADEAAKISAGNQLVELAQKNGDAALADELSGLQSLHRNEPLPAAEMLAESIRKGNKSPDVYLAYGAALKRTGGEAKFEQLMWKLVSDRPTFDEAYLALFNYYLEKNSFTQAMKALQTWTTNDPDSVSARLVNIKVLLETRRLPEAEQMLAKLLDQHADHEAVLSAAHGYYQQNGRLDELSARLEEERNQHPDNRVAVRYLVNIYAFQKRFNDAARVLDATRAGVADDPELLYAISPLYALIDRKDTAEQVLQQVIALDPSHAPASNDLGYGWVDAGKNLDQAEALIRTAVQAEPDNESFLDSLGWALYKRGAFAESLEYLQKAISVATFPDPVVIDHLGDCEYRLHHNDAALAQWKRAAERLKEIRADREDLQQLGLKLAQKLEQLGKAQPVNVAPVAVQDKQTKK